jgi:hypothetical protein
MTYEQQLSEICTGDSVIAEAVNSLSNLQAILSWIPTAGLSLAQFDSVQQDEYNYDILFPWHDHRWITFGVT